ncbi:receptor like protein 50 [Artemisia annua]|uniref:Receptor like protein 50 n=1 Tax=Artemisia annua TaxID=35608 RepID=A0A2U1L2P6_ARTAN|nr:receptor like protein 50 [Artemisia annua]
MWLEGDEHTVSVNFPGLLDVKSYNDSERQALLQIKHNLIDEANRLASWVSEESDCCKWVGIVSDDITGHVHRIHLPGANSHYHGPYSTIGNTKKHQTLGPHHIHMCMCFISRTMVLVFLFEYSTVLNSGSFKMESF